MADYQRVVEYLRDIRVGATPPVTDELRQYAAEYAELCSQANERLRQCSSFLSQGLRSEAIHLAEETPNLLDVVAALDLPEAPLWVEYCQSSGLPVPALLQMDRAAQLNEAYGVEQPLETLLDHHRLLALKRGPVRERLAVIRQLAAQDPTSNFWERDLRTFERARVLQLPSVFYAAVRNQDAGAIAALHKELLETPWLEPVPEDLKTAVQEAQARFGQMQTESALRALLPEIQAAFHAKSLTECVAALKRWKATVQEANLTTLSPDLAAAVEPVKKWVREQEKAAAAHKEFRVSCQELTRALDENAGPAELEAAYVQVQGHQLPIPEELEARYQQRLATQAQGAQRGYRVRLAAVVGTLAAVVIIAAGLTFLYYMGQTASSWANRIHAANVNHDLGTAQRLIQDQERRAANLSSDARVVAAKQETATLLAQFEHDTQIIQGLEADCAPVLAAAKAAATAEKPAVSDLTTAIANLDEAVIRAKNSGTAPWADAEGKLERLRQSLEVTRGQLQERVAGVARAQLDALSQQVDAVLNSRPADAAAQLAAAAAKLAALREMPNLDEATKTAITALSTRIDQSRGTAEQDRQQAAELSALARQATSAEALQKGIEAFVAKFPSSPITADLAKALASFPQDKAVEAWRELSLPWALATDGAQSGTKLSPATAALAGKRLEALQAYLQAFPNSPFGSAAGAYAEYLKQGADALAEKGAWQTSFNDLLTNPVFTEMGYMDVSDGARYYTLGDIKKVQRRVNNQVSVTFEVIDPKNLTKRKQVSVEPPLKLLTEQPVLVPHAKFLLDAADRIKLIDEANWETWGVDLVARLLKDDQVDPVIKAVLVQQALKTTVQLDGWALGDLYDRALRDLARQGAENIVWYDKDRPVTEGTKQAIKKILEALPKSEEVRQLLAAKKAQLAKSLTFNYVSTSMLRKDAGGAWTIPAPAGTAAGATAWVVSSTTAAGTTQPISAMLQAGEFKAGKFEVSDDRVRDLPQGTMVFIVK